MLKWRVEAITRGGGEYHGFPSKSGDRFLISPDERVFVVADGGGSPTGKKASALTVEAVENLWREKSPHTTDRDQARSWIDEAISKANRSILETSRQDSSIICMGSSVVLAVQLENDYIEIGHTGNSRAYLLRDNRSIQLTQDVYEKELPSGQRHQFSLARIGLNEHPALKYTELQLADKDTIIICTDGLLSVFREDFREEFIESKAGQEDLYKACYELVAGSLDSGGMDNTTVITVRYENVPESVTVGHSAASQMQLGDDIKTTQKFPYSEIESLIKGFEGRVADGKNEEGEEAYFRRMLSFQLTHPGAGSKDMLATLHEYASYLLSCNRRNDIELVQKWISQFGETAG